MSDIKHIMAAFVTVNDEFVLDTNGRRYVHFDNARVPVDENGVWQMAGMGGGTVFWFPTLAERDTFFEENPQHLQQNISCGVGDPVDVYTWAGTEWVSGALGFKGDVGATGATGATGETGAGGDLMEPIKVTAEIPGSGVPVNTVFPAGTSIESILRQILNPLVAPTYTPPTLSIAVNVTSAEAGTTAPVTVTPTWRQNDAGSVTASTITAGGSSVWTGTTPSTQTFPLLVRDGGQQVAMSVSHGAGPIKNDSEGNPFPQGAIPAGTAQSGVRTITGFRNAFFEAFDSQQGTNPATSAAIRALSGKVNTSTDQTFNITVPVGTKDVVIAVPGQFTLTEVFDTAINFPITAAFTANHTVTAVEGANGHDPINYNVYRMTNHEGMPNSPVYRVTIN